MKVLIAEDELVSRRVLETALTQWGHDVTACADGGEAWETLQEADAPRLAILDWMMPVLEGTEVCRLAREHPRARRTYIILLTGRGQKDDIVAGLAAGADDYVTKPFDREELRARLRVGTRIVELQDTVLEAERRRVLTETAGGAAHEINQPLTSLLGLVQLMMQTKAPDDPDRQHLEAVQNSGQRIPAIVKKMEGAKQYTTMTYVRGINVVDFASAAATL
jgi:DNA-binding response OmpR family regulator